MKCVGLSSQIFEYGCLFHGKIYETRIDMNLHTHIKRDLAWDCTVINKWRASHI
jgi:hypothetical protein